MTAVLSNVTIEVEEFFGHQAVRVSVPGAGGLCVSLSNPDGARQLARELVRLAVEQGYDPEEEDG